MKAIILIILMSSIALAIYGGDSAVIETFQNCKNITVNVTGEENIDYGEYWFSNCSEIEENLWNCNCDGDYNLTLQTKINTINKYNFIIDYEILVEDGSGGGSNGGGSSGGGSSSHNYYNQHKIIKGNKTDWKDAYKDLEEPNITIPSTTILIESNESATIVDAPITEEEHKARFWWYLIGSIGATLIFAYWVLNKWRGTENGL